MRYFYEGKFYTERTLKSALIKDGTIWVSSGSFYYYPEYNDEVIYQFDILRDILHDNGLITEEEYKHFRKWVNAKIKSGKIDYRPGLTLYHSEYSDNMGYEWDEAFDILRNDDVFETEEEVIENYCNTLSEKEFETFNKLPDSCQLSIAMNWRIKEYEKSR